MEFGPYLKCDGDALDIDQSLLILAGVMEYGKHLQFGCLCSKRPGYYRTPVE